MQLEEGCKTEALWNQDVVASSPSAVEAATVSTTDKWFKWPHKTKPNSRTESAWL